MKLCANVEHTKSARQHGSQSEKVTYRHLHCQQIHRHPLAMTVLSRIESCFYDLQTLEYQQRPTIIRASLPTNEKLHKKCETFVLTRVNYQ